MDWRTGRGEAVAQMQIEQVGEGGGATRFLVTVSERGSSSTHEVTVTDGDYRRLGEGFDSYQDLVRASIEFLLEREPKESILGRFDVADISKYFPEFEREISGGA
jgi:hypothetical protein